MMGLNDIALPELAARLQSVYPRVRILDAYISRVGEEGRLRRQVVRYAAPIEELKAAGLVTDAMVPYGDWPPPDGRRKWPRPPVGDGFWLSAQRFEEPRPVPSSWWDLTIYTDVEHDERADRKDLTFARRALRRIAAGEFDGAA